MSDTGSICAGCGEPRRGDELPSPGRRCIHCRRAGVRRHYVANRRYYLAKAKSRRQLVITSTRDWLIDYLLAHPCVDCGASDIRVLEFDHRDPATKEVAVAVLARNGYSLDRVKAEVDLCDVRCANCHRVRTHDQRGWWGSRLGLVPAEVPGAGP